jgi:hypothetical protein
MLYNAGAHTAAFIRKPLPLTAITHSESDHLVILGTELQSSESHIMYYDIRQPKTPAYSHSSTHSDDITHLSLLPPTGSYLPRFSTTGAELPPRLLLSASTDGLVALSDMRESDEDEAVLCEENWGESIAAAGFYPVTATEDERAGDQPKGLRVWTRSDMDNVATWGVIPTSAEALAAARGEEGGQESAPGPIQFTTPSVHASSAFRNRAHLLPTLTAASRTSVPVPRTAEEEMADKKSANTLKLDYLIDVLPSLGVSSAPGRGPMTASASNAGDIVLQYNSPSTRKNQEAEGAYEPAAYLLSPPSGQGHRDVIRAILHDTRNEAIYTGSEDGILAGWSLAGMPRLMSGDKARDDDGGDGRDMDEDDESEESEIRTESSGSRTRSSSGGMDLDNDDDDDGYIRDRRSGAREEREPGPRNGPIVGADRGKKDKRKTKRHQPY